jgi:hypothetical protein
MSIIIDLFSATKPQCRSRGATPTARRGRVFERQIERHAHAKPWAWHPGWGVAATLIFIVSSGCDGRQSAAERLDKAYKSAGMDPVAGYPLGGRLTIDNEPPVAKSARSRFVAIAYATAKPDAKANSNARVFVKPDGTFELSALPPGKYVMLFAQLDYDPRMGFFGPDGLQNLYNDPDINAKKPEFVIDHQAPGRTDYTFHLSVAGETPPATPGPKAFVGSGPRRN